jgi:cytoskeleton protein RodZ
MNKNKDDGMPMSPGGAGYDAGRDSGANGGKPHPAIAVGARLAAARIEKGRSIEEMAARLKVGPSKVAAIEAGDLSRLHDAVFAIGLVRSYAKVLGVDADPLTNALRSGGQQTPDLALPAASGKQGGMRRANVPLTWSTRRSDRRSWVWGGLAAIVVLALLVVWRLGNEPNGWLQRMKSEAVVAGPVAPDAASTAMMQPGSASAVEEAAAAAASGAVVSALPAPQVSGASDATGAANSAAAATLAAVSSVQATAPGASKATAVTANAASGAAAGAVAAGMSRVTIATTQDSWLSIRDTTGKEVFSGVVHSGQPQVVDGAAPLKVVVGNMSGIASIEKDGMMVDLKTLAGAGKNVARFTLK